MKIHPNEEDSEYALFGKIILLWGHVEMELVNIILRLNYPMSRPKIVFRVPTNFDEKLRFAADRYDAIGELRGLSDRAKSLFTTLPPLHKLRTTIVHGSYQGRLGSNTYQFNFYHSRKSEKSRHGFFYFTHDELIDLLNRISFARREVDALSRATYSIPAPASRTKARPAAKDNSRRSHPKRRLKRPHAPPFRA